MSRIGAIQVLGFIFICSAGAENYTGVDELVNMAKQQNPEILAARARYEATGQKTSIFYHLMDPWAGIEFGEEMRMYSLGQEFPFPTKLSSLSKLARYETDRFYHEYAIKEREIVKRIKIAYARLFMIEREIETMGEVEKILDQMRAVANRHYALNMVTQTDVLRVQVEYLKVENSLVNLDNEKSVVVAELNLLLNRAPGDPLDIKTSIYIPGELPALDTLYQWAKDNQPLLKSFKDQINMARVSLSIARQEYLPDLMLQIEIEEMDMRLQNPRFMIGFTLPVWFLEKQRNMVKEMEAELRMADADYQAMENMIVNMVKETAVMLNNYKREVDLYENSISPG